MDRITITIEEAFDTINRIVDRAENDFHKAYSRFPSLLIEEDYVLLGDYLNISKEEEQREHSISGQDIAFNMIRRYLEREGFFDFAGAEKAKVMNGLLGRLQYNPSSREYQFRVSNLQGVLQKNIEFPPHSEDLFETIKQIGKVCFLKSYEPRYDRAFVIGGSAPKKLPNEKDSTGEKHEKGFINLGTKFVNPAGLYAWFKKWKSYQDAVKEWTPFTEIQFVPGRHHSFYR